MNFDMLVKRHTQAVDALRHMSCNPDMVGSDNWARLQAREQELREERIQRALQRPTPQ